MAPTKWLLALGIGVTARCVHADSLTVATLSKHDPTSWTSDSGCSEAADEDLIECNLRVFSQAVELAANSTSNVDVVLFPEGYALAGSADKTTFLEQLIFNVSDNPCTQFRQAHALKSGTNSTTPQQVALSCLAREHDIAIASNVFTVDPASQEGHITELVFDSSGTLTAYYHKHHLFLTENDEFKPGPFNPTVFDLPYGSGSETAKVGLIICWEGFYPSVTGDWSQLESFATQNATAVLWSIGTSVEFIKDVSMTKTAQGWATKYGFAVAATVDREAGVAFSGGGAAATQVDFLPISVDGYEAHDAAVSVLTMSL